MSVKDTLLKKLCSTNTPKDFTWRELKKLMGLLGYDLVNKKGSRRKFYNSSTKAMLLAHEPHPEKEIPKYFVNLVKKHLKENGLLNE